MTNSTSTRFCFFMPFMLFMVSFFDMDEIDLAQQTETEQRNDAIARARRTGPEKILARCVDCGESIPKERRDACRAAGLPCIRCFFCQDLFAQKGRR